MTAGTIPDPAVGRNPLAFPPQPENGMKDPGRGAGVFSNQTFTTFRPFGSQWPAPRMPMDEKDTRKATHTARPAQRYWRGLAHK